MACLFCIKNNFIIFIAKQVSSLGMIMPGTVDVFTILLLPELPALLFTQSRYHKYVQLNDSIEYQKDVRLDQTLLLTDHSTRMTNRVITTSQKHFWHLCDLHYFSHYISISSIKHLNVSAFYQALPAQLSSSGIIILLYRLQKYSLCHVKRCKSVYLHTNEMKNHWIVCLIVTRWGMGVGTGLK